MKTPTVDRFDRTADGYRHWWQPRLAPACERLVEHLGRLDNGLVAGESREVLDLGCGTGNLVLQAVTRWTGARFTGLDASTSMLAVADADGLELDAASSSRLSWVEALADAVPAQDATFDVVMSSFVVQQVPDRMAVLREVFRVLRPGGLIGLYGWLPEIPHAPEVALFAAMTEAGVSPEQEKGKRAGRYDSGAQAADELLEVGFVDVEAHDDVLEHHWEIEEFLDYRITTREVDAFGALDTQNVAAIRADTTARLRALTPEQMIDRPPVVRVVGRKPR
jgi:SAM-dependent methyltransferase